ncbi:hypothetical protein ACYOEI_00075 [Singulisphaera rosea]
MRSSYIFNFIVRQLTKDLYKTSPTRTILGHPVATAWLENVYKDQAMFAKWQAADRLSTVAQVAAFQVSGSPNPTTPIKIHLWDSSQFAVWTDPDDPLNPAAVATIDSYDCQRRYTLWTVDEVRTYITDKLAPGQTSGGTAPRLMSTIPNPYRVKTAQRETGIIPFSFVHWDYPSVKFWTESPGCLLAEINDNINTRLTQLADQVRYIGAPIGYSKNTIAGWSPKAPHLPGEFIQLAASADTFDKNAPPEIGFLEADLAFVKAAWDDIENLVNHTLETMGVPQSAVRFIASAARSGESIKAEQLPLLMWAQSRQPSFAHYERDLARLVLQVATSHLANHKVPNPDLETALREFDLNVRWQPLFTDGESRNREDDWDLANQLTSRVQILMRRYSMSREDALAHLKQVEQDQLDEATILGPEAAIITPPVSTTGGEDQSESTDFVESE